MKAFTTILSGLIIAPLSAIWNGYVISIIWRWFMVTTFNLSPLNIPQSIGLALIVGYLSHQEIDQKEHEYPLIRAVVITLVKGGCTLLIGAIVKGFL